MHSTKHVLAARITPLLEFTPSAVLVVRLRLGQSHHVCNWTLPYHAFLQLSNITHDLLKDIHDKTEPQLGARPSPNHFFIGDVNRWNHDSNSSAYNQWWALNISGELTYSDLCFFQCIPQQILSILNSRSWNSPPLELEWSITITLTLGHMLLSSPITLLELHW